MTGHAPNYPMIGDTDLAVSKLYGMLPAGAGETCEGRSAADNATVRTVFVIGPDKLVKLMLSYPMSTGRNFDEILRVLDSLQLTAKHKVATPVNWRQGEDVIIVPAVPDEAARAAFPGGGGGPARRAVPRQGGGPRLAEVSGRIRRIFGTPRTRLRFAAVRQRSRKGTVRCSSSMPSCPPPSPG